MITEFKPRRRRSGRTWIVAAAVAFAGVVLWFFTSWWSL